jgi:hypothetical protein
MQFQFHSEKLAIKSQRLLTSFFSLANKKKKAVTLRNCLLFLPFRFPLIFSLECSCVV